MIARCLFCGSDDVRLSGLATLRQCVCRGCGASGPMTTDALEAERKWAEIPYLSSRLASMRYGDLPTTGSPDYGIDVTRLIPETRG